MLRGGKLDENNIKTKERLNTRRKEEDEQTSNKIDGKNKKNKKSWERRELNVAGVSCWYQYRVTMLDCNTIREIRERINKKKNSKMWPIMENFFIYKQILINNNLYYKNCSHMNLQKNH